MKTIGKKVIRVLALSGLLAAVLASAWSRTYWGYYCVPPALPRAVLNATVVVSVTRYSAFDHEPRKSLDIEEFRPSPDQRRFAPRFREDPEYRIPYQLLQAGLLTGRARELSDDQVKTLVQPLAELHKDTHYGTVYELDGPQGRHVIFCGTSFPLDHRTYRETVARLNPERRLTVVSSRSFNYDAAGLEFLTWGLVFSISCAVIAVLSMLWLAVVAGARMFRKTEERIQQQGGVYSPPATRTAQPTP